MGTLSGIKFTYYILWSVTTTQNITPDSDACRTHGRQARNSQARNTQPPRPKAVVTCYNSSPSGDQSSRQSPDQNSHYRCPRTLLVPGIPANPLMHINMHTSHCHPLPPHDRLWPRGEASGPGQHGAVMARSPHSVTAVARYELLPALLLNLKSCSHEPIISARLLPESNHNTDQSTALHKHSH